MRGTWLVAAMCTVGLSASAQAQWYPAPYGAPAQPLPAVRGWTTTEPPPPMADTGAYPALAPPERPMTAAIDPGSLPAGGYAFEAGTGVPMLYVGGDVSLGRGLALGAELAWHGSQTARALVRAQLGFSSRTLFGAAQLEGSLPIYFGDRIDAPDSINDADGAVGLRLRGGIKLGAGVRLYVEPTLRFAFDSDPRVDPLEGTPSDLAVVPVFGAGVGAAIHLFGPLGVAISARGETGADRGTQALELHIGLFVAHPALGRGAAEPI